MRQRKISDEDILTLHQQGKNQTEIAKVLGVSNVAIHKRLKRLLQAPILDPLTPKKRRFALAVAQGKSRTQAALEAFDCNSRQSAKALQKQLKQDATLEQSIADLIEARLPKKQQANILCGHAENTKDPQTSLRALDMVFRVQGAYSPEQVHIHSEAVTLELTEKSYREMIAAKYGQGEDQGQAEGTD